jgi:hypothetical protein
MSTEIKHLFITLEQLRKMLEDSINKANEASDYADEIGGEFEQELSSDLDTIQESLQEILDELESSIEEGKTLWDDELSLENSLIEGMDDEENYKIDSEHIQDELEQEKAEEEEDRK